MLSGRIAELSPGMRGGLAALFMFFRYRRRTPNQHTEYVVPNLVTEFLFGGSHMVPREQTMPLATGRVPGCRCANEFSLACNPRQRSFASAFSLATTAVVEAT